jgi:hypothetical protein
LENQGREGEQNKTKFEQIESLIISYKNNKTKKSIEILLKVIVLAHIWSFKFLHLANVFVVRTTLSNKKIQKKSKNKTSSHFFLKRRRREKVFFCKAKPLEAKQNEYYESETYKL